MQLRLPLSAAAALVLAGLAASPSSAQVAPDLACPDSGAVVLSADRPSVDTTYHLSVERREWRWTQESVGVAAGVHGTRPASWRACAGAWASFDEATVLVENARGRVRVRASLEPLLEVLRRHAAPPRENPEREKR